MSPLLPWGSPPGSSGGGGSQTPWTSNINAANYNLYSLNNLAIGTSTSPSFAGQISLGATATLSSASNNGSSIYDGNNYTVTASIGASTWRMANTTTISTGQGFATTGALYLSPTWTFNGGVLNWSLIQGTPTLSGSTPPSNSYLMYFVPNIETTGTWGLISSLYIYPGISSGVTVTKYIGIELGLSGSGTITTAVGLDIGVTQSIVGTTVYAMQVGNYQSFHQGNFQFASQTVSFGGGAGVVGIANATTAPSTTPSGGGVLYASAGALYWYGSSGTTTKIASA